MDGAHRKEPSGGAGLEAGAGECEGECVRDGKELANDSQNV